MSKHPIPDWLRSQFSRIEDEVQKLGPCGVFTQMRTVTQAYFEQQAEADQPPALGGEAELDGLSFQKLRQANVKRLTSSKYKLCEQNWQPAHWMNALTGEAGECANIIKKVDRGDYSLESALPNIARELADIHSYLDILAFKLGIDLGAATVSKFDEVSERIGSSIRLGEPVKEPDVCGACNGKREVFHRGLEDSWYEPCNACLDDVAKLNVDQS
ncbi:MazG-like family protein [Pseudomonas tremae]|uniref:MazG-like family protein n=1 Tax=Pseudomonas syringae group TaxID=136849 RepID=UPI0001AF3D97|nr:MULTISPECIES: MazG-like family protein [Pseudomonas syringae group]MCQ3014733.1 MazG-like family protein [Pseudomonas tremae]QGL56727.1 nucleotide pyrophosphohydrolase [Pseudomonas coronafaciens pv. oryzae str. 1_6]RMM31293.1 hypothetical protein ALQ80_01727 [Pseudomonas coronafaciens pv. oryzae]